MTDWPTLINDFLVYVGLYDFLFYDKLPEEPGDLIFLFCILSLSGGGRSNPEEGCLILVY